MSNNSKWVTIKLGHLVHGFRGVSYRPEDLQSQEENDSVILLRANNIQKGKLALNDIQLVPAALVSTQQQLRDGDIAVCMSNGSKHLVGKSALATQIDAPMTVGAFCSVFKPVIKELSCFIFQLFNSQAYQKHIDIALSGSAINNLKNSDIESAHFIVPASDKVKQKIATILSTVDTAIEKTEALIAKYHQIKAGLMHDLFTRGVLPNGQLRPPREQAPELYQETAIGWIPKGWEVSPLGKMGDIFNGTTPSREISSYWNGEIPWLSSGKINDYIIETPSEYVTHLALLKTPLQIVPSGAVLVGLIGQGRTRGMSARTSINATINQNIAAIVVNDSNVSEFVHQYLDHNYERLRSVGRGSNQSALNCEILRLFEIAKPSKKEQSLISQTLLGYENKKHQEKKLLSKLQQQKLGLMQDLLTGKVPVSVNEPEAANG